MALSDWDTLALNEKSEPTNGVFRSPSGVGIEVYKNFLYLRDEKAWDAASGSSRPYVGQISEGSLFYKDVVIEARRGPQGGIYCVIKSTVHSPCLKKKCEECQGLPYPDGQGNHSKTCSKYEPTRRFIMVGCGVYGYGERDENDQPNWLGVLPSSLDWLRAWLDTKETTEHEVMHSDEAPFTEEEKAEWLENYRKNGTVIHERDGRYFMEWSNYEFDEHVRAIDLTKARRFNQGDAFFVAAMEAGEVSEDMERLPSDEGLKEVATPVGETQIPTAMLMLGKQ